MGFSSSFPIESHAFVMQAPVFLRRPQCSQDFVDKLAQLETESYTRGYYSVADECC